jgi:hypothetical protein
LNHLIQTFKFVTMPFKGVMLVVKIADSCNKEIDNKLIFPPTVKLGFNELGCFQSFGYNEQIFKSNWLF